MSREQKIKAQLAAYLALCRWACTFRNPKVVDAVIQLCDNRAEAFRKRWGLTVEEACDKFGDQMTDVKPVVIG